MAHAKPLSRRRLLRAAAAGVACVATAPAVAAEGGPPPVVDTHQHLWDLKRFRLPWLDGAGEALNRTFTLEDYVKAAAGLNVVQAVYMEVDVEPGQRDDEDNYVIDVCRRGVGPTVAAVIGGATDRAEFSQWIRRFKGDRFAKGVRSSFDAGLAAEATFVKNLGTLGDLGMSFDINTGPAGLAKAAAVAAQCPRTRFILDHCGNVDAGVFRRTDAPSGASETKTLWQRGIAALAERPNVVCKISGVLEAAASSRVGDDEYAAVINHCLDRFGPDRVMFASNWPVVNRAGSFASWLRLLRSVTAGRSADARRKLFADNAMRLYSLPNG
jgi:predicted TIM-barrel fold metal-dependent hydrolase